MNTQRSPLGHVVDAMDVFNIMRSESSKVELVIGEAVKILEYNNEVSHVALHLLTTDLDERWRLVPMTAPTITAIIMMVTTPFEISQRRDNIHVLSFL